MDFEDFRRRLDRLFTEHATDRRGYASGLHDALVETKVAVGMLQDGVVVTEQALVAEKDHLQDADRRGRLAGGIGDTETAAVAEKFAARHRERVELLERKLAVQRDELRLAEGQVAELTDMLRLAKQGAAPPYSAVGDGIGSGGGAGGSAYDPDAAGLQRELERQAKAAAVEAQLAALKRKLGK